MSHYSYRPKGQDVELSVDYVVVGSGAGGATAAVTLARAGAQVALVEAGPWRDPEHYPSTVYGAMRDLFDEWGVQITRGKALWPIVQARTMGGTTVINSAICVRTPADIFEQWQREHGVGGDDFAKTMWAHQDVIERELHVSETPPQSLGHSNRLAMLGAKKADVDSHWIRRYVKDCEGTGQCLQGCRKGRKQSTNVNYVPEVLELGGDIFSSAPVKRVLLEGNRAVGVTGRFQHPATRGKGGEFTVRAKKAVIVAASATHSPALLERSGVKSPALGTLFRAHPGTGVFGLYDDPVDMSTGATQGWASTQFRTDPGLKLETLSIPFEMVASRWGGGGQELMKRLTEFRHAAMWVHAVRAESKGTVKNGLGDRPVVKYTLDHADMLRFRAGMHLVGKLHVAAGAKALIPGIVGLPYKLMPNEVDMLLDAPLDPKKYIAILSHLFGGCPMGSDPTRSFTDGNGRVHGYEGLVVADASVIPTNLGVNPQHTIMALARTFAERLVA